ncbi:MAG: ABC transporter ATP-binding protein [Opitutaceae bacterium]|nr:ABC transporter ATP-binding protein [Opitutaceae bacterium]
MPAKVKVRDLSKRYGGLEAVRGVSFEVEAGEIFGLLGPNGAGKTTTVECLLGLREPDTGQLEVCGFDSRRQSREAKQRLGAALQSTALQDKITPREAVALFASFYRVAASPDTLLERFELADKANARFETLSGGQRQRLALALAFVNRPEVVLLDEPTTGLDPHSRRELHVSIRRMKEDGCTVLLTTHYLEEAEQLCDRVAIIDHGRIVATGAPRELVAASRSALSVTLTLRPGIEAALLASVPGVDELRVEGGTVSFRTRDATDTLATVTQLLREKRIEILDLHVRKASLEDVFLALTGNGESTPEAGG